MARRTVNIDDSIWYAARKRALDERRSVSSFIEAAVAFFVKDNPFQTEGVIQVHQPKISRTDPVLSDDPGFKE